MDHIIEGNRERFPEPYRTQLTQHQLKIAFDGAISDAIKRVKRNYKTAVPQFYRPLGIHDGRIQLLLPLCLNEPPNADLAITVERRGDLYVASTILTLEMAYKNSRLIARPDSDWLSPSRDIRSSRP